MNIRFPNIQGDTKEQLEGIKSYLYQLTQELNFGLTQMGTGQAPSQPGAEKEAPAAVFNDVKALIIKSADIVNAYYEEISKRLEGVYVAQSDFGTFSQETAGQLTATDQKIEQNYENVQKLLADMQQSIIDVTAYINTGLLYYDAAGAPVYGMEVGQRTEKDGQAVFHKYARFTADKLAFYDQTGAEAAYISDRKLRIPNALVENTFTRGGFEDTVAPDGSLVTRWVGV